MLKSCQYCGRVHDVKHDCGKRPQPRKKKSEIDRFRWSPAWKSKRAEIRERDSHVCQVCIRGLWFRWSPAWKSKRAEIRERDSHVCQVCIRGLCDPDRRYETDGLRDKRARPAKSTKTKTGTITKEEQAAREAVESALQGGTDKLEPPEYLTSKQETIFDYLIEQLDESKMLGNLDLFILSQAAITIDRLERLNRKANDDPECIYETSFRQANTEAMKDFFRCCNELCLSPQSRAKLSISAVKSTETRQTLMDILNEEDDE
ncbi:Phage terminase, small subunit [Popillia japonica]|uniref:Phage terminase, small subunit n=1 Tax=Popillia japonica TaxID=7064 RepID=A0AAW1HVX4_POPJA